MNKNFASSMFSKPTSGFVSTVCGSAFVRAGALTFCLFFGNMSASATASTYQIQIPSERTGSGPARLQLGEPTDTAAAAVLEVRRRANLTWDELADLFQVSRRSVHNWASGSAVTTKHEQAVRQTLAVVRRFDRGASAETRALMFTADAEGMTVLGLLKDERFQDAFARASTPMAATNARVALSKKAQEARRPPAPGLLLDAVQSRPDIPARARIARVMRVPKTIG